VCVLGLHKCWGYELLHVVVGFWSSVRMVG
jgi:hypothetical protein